MLYQPRLVTLDYVRLHRKLGAGEVADDTLLEIFIEEASAVFQSECQRTFMPYVATKRFSHLNQWTSYELHLRDDLLEVTTLTDSAGSAIASGYTLLPDNDYPKSRISLDSASGRSWWFPYRESRVEVAGIWGCVPHYGRCWRDSGVNVPGAGLTDSATSIVLGTGEGARFQEGQYIKIGAEVLLVSSIATNTLTVRRGELGTTPAAHTSAEDLLTFDPLPDVAKAVREIAVYAYLHKDQIGGRVQVFDGGMVTVEDLDPQVAKTIARYRFKHMPRGV